MRMTINQAKLLLLSSDVGIVSGAEVGSGVDIMSVSGVAGEFSASSTAGIAGRGSGVLSGSISTISSLSFPVMAL